MATSTPETFELHPSPVRHGRRPWPAVVAVMAAGLAIVVVAVLADRPSGATSADALGTTPSSTVPTPVAAAAAQPGEAGAMIPTAAPQPRSIPASLTCHDLDRSACRLAVASALGALGPELPSVESAEARSGLLCGDTPDCPNTGLHARLTPLANVVLRLRGGGPAAWINVIYRSHGRPLDFDPSVEAWIARWGSGLRPASGAPHRRAR